jgi:hypothetical protein
MVPNSRATLAEYCLRNLGAPVLEINVDDDQISDRIDEAIQYYQEFHSDAIQKTFLKHQITQDDIDNQWIPVPDVVTTVQRIYPTSTRGGAAMFDIQYQMFLNDMFNLGFSGRLAEYYHTKQYLNLMDDILNPMPRTRYVRHGDRLYIDTDWKNRMPVGSYVIVDCYRIVDPDENSSIYNDMYLKRYATALIKRQWGINLKKFEGMQLPGGVSLNGQVIFDEANNEIQKLEEEIRLVWENPVSFFVG